MEKVCTNKNHSYKHNEQINKRNIDNFECFGVKFVKNLSRNDFTIIFNQNHTFSKNYCEVIMDFFDIFQMTVFCLVLIFGCHKR